MALINDRNKEYDWAFWVIFAVTALETAFYLYVAIRGIGTVSISNYLPIALSLLMYASIVTYTIDFFKKGNFNSTLDQMLFKFGMSSLSALIGLKEGNDIVFVCTAIMVFFVPGIIGGWLRTRKQMRDLIIVFICASVAAVVNIVHPVEKYLSYMGRWVYNVDALNQVVQWSLFVFLAYIRTRVCIRDRILILNKEENRLYVNDAKE